jgi:release factor glutamine methyltransferase
MSRGPRARQAPRGGARARDAGHNGRVFVDRICEDAPAVLRPHGVLLMVHSAMCDSVTILRRLSEAGMRATISDRAFIPLGPVLKGRLPWLRESAAL